MQTTNRISGTQPSNNPVASSSLYVGDLASDVTEATLFELFNAVGPVASIRVCCDATTRRSLGYAYINFHSVQDAERALDTINFTDIRGKQCRIMWSRRDPRLRKSANGNIFVKNLPESFDNKRLYDTFSVFGNILSCKVVIDKTTQRSRGYGYVHYVDDKSAKKAIEGANGMMILDRKVHVELFKPREERKKNYKYQNVYVKYIPKNWNETILKKIFEEATGGKIDKFEMWRRDYGVSACLHFSNSDAAKSAVEKLNDKDVSSFDIPNDLLIKQEEKNDEEMINNNNNITSPTKLYVARAQKRKERKKYLQRQQRKSGGGNRRNYTGANLYAKNLSPDVDDTKLHEMFMKFGTITSAKVMREQSGKSRGFGFVAFEKKEAATRAIHEMTNTLHHGKPLYVSRAQTKAFRQTFIMKQLRNKRMRNNMGQQSGGYDGGGGYGRPSNMGRQMQQFPGQMSSIQQAADDTIMNNIVVADIDITKNNMNININQMNINQIQESMGLHDILGTNVYYKANKSIKHDSINYNNINQNNKAQSLQQIVQSNNIFAWLSEIVCLPQYYNIFIKEGFEDFETVLEVKETDLIEMHIDRKEHRVKILDAVQQIKSNRNIKI